MNEEELIRELRETGENERQYEREARIILSKLLEEAATTIERLKDAEKKADHYKKALERRGVIVG